jgi:T5orf172 domain
MEMEFQPTRSFAYRFARYVIVPELLQLPEVQSGKPFILRDLAWPLIDKHLTPEQQTMLVKKAQSDTLEPMGRIVRFWVPYLVGEHGQDLLVNLGKGEWRTKTEADVSDADLEDAAIEDEEDENLGGHIYAFPTIVRDNGHFPIKVGKTTGDVAARVTGQCKGAAAFEQPVVLATWLVKRVGPTELAIHNILKARGKHREDAPGQEWFNTTIEELKAIIEFVTG